MGFKPVVLASALAWTALTLTLSYAEASSEGPVLTLEAAIRRAVAAAPSLRASEEELRGTVAEIGQAGVRPNPEVGLEAEDILGSGDFSGFDSSQTTLAIGKRFERGGKREARISLAESKRDIAWLRRARERLDVILAAQKAYVEVLAAAAARTNAANRYRLAADLEKTVKKRVDAALDSAAAAQRIAIQTLEARTNLDQAQRALNLVKRQLSMLWREQWTGYSVDERRLYAINGIGALPNGFPRERIPDIALSTAAQNKADAAIALEVAHAKQDPTIRLGVRHLAESDDVAAVVSFSIPLALFDTNQGNIDRAIAERSKAEWEAVEFRRGFDRQVARLVDMINAAKSEALGIRANMIPKAEQALSATRQGYERGAFTYLEVLEAQRTLRDLQAREISALRKFHLAKAELDRLTAKFHAPFPGEEVWK